VCPLHIRNRLFLPFLFCIPLSYGVVRLNLGIAFPTINEGATFIGQISDAYPSIALIMLTLRISQAIAMLARTVLLL
jgi:hypothetical protein